MLGKLLNILNLNDIQPSITFVEQLYKDAIWTLLQSMKSYAVMLEAATRGVL